MPQKFWREPNKMIILRILLAQTVPESVGGANLLEKVPGLRRQGPHREA